MKKFVLILLFFLGFSLSVSAQDKKFSTGLGAEFNMNSRHNFAGGAVWNFCYNMPLYTSIGVTVTGSSNFSGFHVIEPTLLFR
jgi:hypothetical protein